MPKIAEKLTILVKTGEALLQRLVHTKQVLNDANLKPVFLTDNNNLKILSNVLKKFPEITDLPTLEQVLISAIDHLNRLEVYYDTLVDSMLFTKSSIEVIEEVTNSIPIFKLEKNPILTIAFLDLISLLIRTLITLNQINDRKNVLLVYSKLYEKKQQRAEENYSETAIFLNQFENPFKRLQTILSEQANQSIGHSLIDTMTPFLAGYTVDHLRNTGVLSLSFTPGKMCLPPTTLDLLIIKHSPKFLMWVSYGFLLTPEHFAMPEPLEILKIALQQSYLTPSFGSEVAFLHEAYESVIGSHKTQNKPLQKQLKKDKKVFGECLNQSLQPQVGLKHRNDRRLYVRHELHKLLLLVKDFPGLLGPKIEIIWGALSIAKEEIFWYFNHKTKPAPKAVSKLYHTKNYVDPHIGELISYMLEIVDLIKYYKGVIQEYYISYLKGCDYEKLTALVQDIVGRGGNKIADILNSILNDMRSVTLESVNDKQFNFDALRLNWFRVETWLSLPSCPCGSLDTNNELTKRMYLIVSHTKNIDSLDELIEEYSSLAGLIQFPQTIIQEFEMSLTSSQATHSLTWIRLITTFPSQVNEYIAEEKDKYGLASVFMAQKCIGKLASRIGELIQNIIDHHIKIDSQLDPTLFVQPTNMKNTPNNVPQIASESSGKSRQVIMDLRNSFNILYRIISTLRSYSSYLCVHDQSFYPIAFLREMLIDLIRSFILKNLTLPAEKDQSVNIQRPSVILKRINIARRVFSSLEDHIPFNVHILINDVIFSLIYNHVFDSEDALHWVTVKDLPPLAPLILPISEWYFDFVNRRMEYGAVIYSPIRKSFVSRTAFKADDYCSSTELQALVALVGPLGIKLIDRQLLDLIAKNISGIKDHLQANIDDLREIENSFTSDQCITIVKRIKDLEGFYTKAKTIGNCLVFRGLLAEALEKQTSTSLPFIHSSVKLQISQNRETLLPDKELQLIEEIAHSVGIPVHYSDLPLDIVLGNIAQGSSDLWSLLPYMFAACFATQAWSNINNYKPTIDAFPNNAHVLSLTISTLLSRMVPLSSKTDPEAIKQLFFKYVEVSANLLLRLVKLSARDLQKKGVNINIPSAIMFLDMFVRSSPFLSFDMLESVLPYSLIRSMCHDFYVSDVKDIRDSEN